MMRRLNLGSGYDDLDGWVHLDRRDFVERTLSGDFGALPFTGGAFDLVVCNHALQMTPYTQIPAVLSEIHRVMRRGGVLRVLVPDLARAVAAWQRGDADWFPIVDEAEQSIDGKLCAYLTWYSEARTVFTGPWLVEWLNRSGFSAAIVPGGESSYAVSHEGVTALDSRLAESTVVEGVRL